MPKQKVFDEAGEELPAGDAVDWDAAERAAIQAESAPEEPPPVPEPAPAPEPEAPPPPMNEPPPVKPPATSIVQSRLATMKDLLERTAPQFAAIIPKHLTAERMFGVAYAAMARNPGLMECTAVSLIRGILIGAQLGLDVSGVGGQAYLVPFKNNRTHQTEATFIAGYRGLIDLAIRSRLVAWIAPGVVYKQDPEFSYIVNPIPMMVHRPSTDGPGDDKDVVGAYSVATFRDPDVPAFPYVLSLKQILKARSSSKAYNSGASGPWTTHFPEMCMKTAIRAHAKYLPSSPELNTVLDLEDRAEAGEGSFPLPGELLAMNTPEEGAQDVTPEAPAPPAKGSTAALSRRLKKA